MLETELAIVGAGPAGLAAALEAAEAGARVTIFDEQVATGGQIYRQPPATMVVEEGGARPGQALRAAAEAHPQITIHLGATVWGFVGDRVLAYSNAQGGGRLRAGQVLLAPGCYDRPVAFPGWTLPGVMTAGGIQTLVKSQHLLPGERILLVGAHPFLLVVAAQLLRAGARLEAVVLAQKPQFWEALTMLPRLWGHGSKLREAWQSLRVLREQRVPLRFGQVVTRALGDQVVEGAVLAEADEAWRPIPGTEYRVTADTIGIGYGFLPSTELARQAGVATRWVKDQGGWVVECDAQMRTNLPGVLVAGEITGVAGAEVAMEEGRLAALTAAQALGYLSAAEAAERGAVIQGRLAHYCRFASALTQLSSPQEGLFSLVTPETVVCRCESLTAESICRSLSEHGHLRSSDSVKLATRAGMGLCQGRYCASTVAHLIAEATGQTQEQVGIYRARPPVKPIPIAHLVGVEEA